MRLMRRRCVNGMMRKRKWGRRMNMFINTPIDLHSHECEHSLTRSFIDMNLCVIIDTFVGTFLEFRMNTSRGAPCSIHTF